MTENEAKAKGVKYGRGVFPWAASGRSLSLDLDEGVTKLLFDEATNACSLRHRRPKHRQPDRRGGAGDRDGSGYRGHRPDRAPAPESVGDSCVCAEMFEGTITDLIVPKKK
jgi:dihydrolipoamide dehydrogenase